MHLILVNDWLDGDADGTHDPLAVFNVSLTVYAGTVQFALVVFGLGFVFTVGTPDTDLDD